jgi:hypothetical protein
MTVVLTIENEITGLKGSIWIPKDTAVCRPPTLRTYCPLWSLSSMFVEEPMS